MCQRVDSNHRPKAYESSALPLSYSGKFKDCQFTLRPFQVKFYFPVFLFFCAPFGSPRRGFRKAAKRDIHMSLIYLEIKFPSKLDSPALRQFFLLRRRTRRKLKAAHGKIRRLPRPAKKPERQIAHDKCVHTGTCPFSQNALRKRSNPDNNEGTPRDAKRDLPQCGSGAASAILSGKP